MSFSAFLQSMAGQDPTSRALVSNLQLPIDTKVDPTADTPAPDQAAGAAPVDQSQAAIDSQPAAAIPTDVPQAAASTPFAPSAMPAYQPVRDTTDDYGNTTSTSEDGSVTASVSKEDGYARGGAVRKRAIPHFEDGGYTERGYEPPPAPDEMTDFSGGTPRAASGRSGTYNPYDGIKLQGGESDFESGKYVDIEGEKVEKGTAREKELLLAQKQHAQDTARWAREDEQFRAREAKDSSDEVRLSMIEYINAHTVGKGTKTAAIARAQAGLGLARGGAVPRMNYASGGVVRAIPHFEEGGTADQDGPPISAMADGPYMSEAPAEPPPPATPPDRWPTFQKWAAEAIVTGLNKTREFMHSAIPSPDTDQHAEDYYSGKGGNPKAFMEVMDQVSDDRTPLSDRVLAAIGTTYKWAKDQASNDLGKSVDSAIPHNQMDVPPQYAPPPVAKPDPTTVAVEGIQSVHMLSDAWNAVTAKDMNRGDFKSAAAALEHTLNFMPTGNNTKVTYLGGGYSSADEGKKVKTDTIKGADNKAIPDIPKHYESGEQRPLGEEGIKPNPKHPRMVEGASYFPFASNLPGAAPSFGVEVRDSKGNVLDRFGISNEDVKDFVKNPLTFDKGLHMPLRSLLGAPAPLQQPGSGPITAGPPSRDGTQEGPPMPAAPTKRWAPPGDADLAADRNYDARLKAGLPRMKGDPEYVDSKPPTIIRGGKVSTDGPPRLSPNEQHEQFLGMAAGMPQTLQSGNRVRRTEGNRTDRTVTDSVSESDSYSEGNGSGTGSRSGKSSSNVKQGSGSKRSSSDTTTYRGSQDNETNTQGFEQKQLNPPFGTNVDRTLHGKDATSASNDRRDARAWAKEEIEKDDKTYNTLEKREALYDRLLKKIQAGQPGNVGGGGGGGGAQPAEPGTTSPPQASQSTADGVKKLSGGVLYTYNAKTKEWDPPGKQR